MGVTWDLHRRIIGRTREEDARHFLGKMKKEAVFFGEERKKMYLCIWKSETGTALRAPNPIYSQSSSNYASPACEDALHVANKSLRQKDTGLRADTHIL